MALFGNSWLDEYKKECRENDNPLFGSSLSDEADNTLEDDKPLFGKCFEERCPICGDSGEYTIGRSFGGGEQLVKCNCKTLKSE